MMFSKFYEIFAGKESQIFLVLLLNEIKFHQLLETECCILIEFKFFPIISLKLPGQFN